MIEDKTLKLGRMLQPRMLDDGTVDLKGISFTQASMWLRCPRQYKFRYIEGKRLPPAIALTEGTSHHTAMEEDNKRKRDQGKQIQAVELTEIFVDKFDREVARAKEEAEKLKVTVDWEDESRDGIIKRAGILHEDYAGKWSKTVEPVRIESTFARRVDVEGVDFTMFGQLDLTTKSGHLLDYKTSARSKSQRDVDVDLQLTLNSWASGHSQVGWFAFVKEKPHVQYLTSKRTTGQHLWGIKVVAEVVKAIRAGQFPLTNPGAFPAPWWCSKTHCGYWGICRGAYEA
jgi:hypothetical protein